MITADSMAGLGPATILRGDARHLPLTDESVDLVVTSPPYFALRSYRDGGEHYSGQIGSERTPRKFVDALIECTREMMRVLKPAGSIWVNLGDKYAGQNMGQISNHGVGGSIEGGIRFTSSKRRGAASPGGVRDKSLIGIPWRYALRCIDDLGLILRSEVIWSKPNGLPESVTDRVRRSHEHWFHLVKQPRYFAAVDEIREPHIDNRINGMTWEQRKARGDAMRQGEQSGTFGAGMPGSPLGKLPGSVREVPSQPLRVPPELGVDHFAAFPPAWPAWIIRGWSPPSGVVLDPFGGTGTTAMAARALGRQGISVDYSADYCRLARWRCTDLDELAAVRGLPRENRASRPDQTDLFDLPEVTS